MLTWCHIRDVAQICLSCHSSEEGTQTIPVTICNKHPLPTLLITLSKLKFQTADRNLQIIPLILIRIWKKGQRLHWTVCLILMQLEGTINSLSLFLLFLLHNSKTPWQNWVTEKNNMHLNRKMCKQVSPRPSPNQRWWSNSAQKRSTKSKSNISQNVALVQKKETILSRIKKAYPA